MALDQSPLLKAGDRIPPFIKTRTGRTYTHSSPVIRDIVIGDVAHSLSNQCRFGGHTREFFSIAQHSVDVARRMYIKMKGHDEAIRRDAGLVGLLHDAHEAFIGDVTTPFKMLLGNEYRQAERLSLEAVEQAFDMEDLNEKYHDLMKECDREMLYSDALRFGMDGVRTDEKGVEHVAPRIWTPPNAITFFANEPAYAPGAAKEIFLNLFTMLGGAERTGARTL